MRAELKALIVSAGVFSTGYSMLVFSIPLSAAAIGSSQSELGLISVLYVLPSFFMPLVIGKFLDRMTSRIVHFAVVAFAVSTLLFPYSSSFVEMACIRALQGFFGVAFWVSIEKELADRSPFAERGRTMGFYNMSWASAFCLGLPLAGFLIDYYGFKEVFYVSFLLQVAALAPLVHSCSGGIQSESPSSYILEEQKASLLGPACLVAGMTGAIVGPLFSLFPVFVTNEGFSAVWAGLFMLVFSGSRVAAFLTAGLLVDRIGAWRLMLGGTLLLTSVVAVGLIGRTELLGLMMLLGFAFGMAYTSALTLASRSLPEIRGAAIGKFETAFNLGIAATSQLGGISADLIGPWSTYVLSGGITLIGFILTVYWTKSNWHHRYANGSQSTRFN